MDSKTTPRRIRAAIFDFDGTLSDSMYVWNSAPIELVRRHGGQPPENMLELIAPMTIDEAMVFIRDEFIPGGDIAALKRELYGIIDGLYRYEVPPKPGAMALIKRLHSEGIPICVVSATDSYLIRSALERFGVCDLFEFISFSDDFGGKMHPECYLNAAARMGSDAVHTAVFEDALHAARTAKAAGFYLVGAFDESARGERAELIKISDWCGDDISEWRCELA